MDRQTLHNMKFTFKGDHDIYFVDGDHPHHHLCRTTTPNISMREYNNHVRVYWWERWIVDDKQWLHCMNTGHGLLTPIACMFKTEQEARERMIIIKLMS